MLAQQLAPAKLRHIVQFGQQQQKQHQARSANLRILRLRQHQQKGEMAQAEHHAHQTPMQCAGGA